MFRRHIPRLVAIGLTLASASALLAVPALPKRLNPKDVKNIQAFHGNGAIGRNTIRAQVCVQDGWLIIENHDKFNWSDISIYVDCFGKPENFMENIDMYEASTGKVMGHMIRLTELQRRDGTKFNPSIGNRVDDVLIICDTPRGERKGRWYGMAHK